MPTTAHQPVTMPPPLPGTLRSDAPGPVRWVSMPTMLLVEDSRLTAEVFRLFCRRAAIRLRRAETVSAALAHLRVYRPDVVVIDLGLPDGSGLDLIARLAAARPAPARIVAISGDGDSAEAAIAAGADAFLAKPMHLVGSAARALGLSADLITTPGGVTRNEGGDPLAMVDDLRQARALLDAVEDAPDDMAPPASPHPPCACTPPQSSARKTPSTQIAYALQFARTLAISLRDDDLLAASHATGPAQRAALRRAIDARLVGRAIL